MKVLNVLVISVFCLLDGTSADFAVPRGVPMSQSKKYEQFKLNDIFTCDDQSISFSKVNDGYCDCPGKYIGYIYCIFNVCGWCLKCGLSVSSVGGEDEPGTSACSLSRFYCINKGHRGEWVPSSRVDDGICDCCDGSDESSVCALTCEEEASEASIRDAARIRIMEDGARLKQE